MIQIFNTELQRYNLDALYVTNPVNVRYLSGFTGSFGVVFILKNRMVLVTDARYYEEARRSCQGTDVLSITDPEWQKVINSCQRIGFESDHMTVERFNSVSQKFQHAKWIPSSVVMQNARRKKNMFEVTAIKKACEIGDNCFKEIQPFITEGVTEVFIARKLAKLARKQDVEDLSFTPIVAFEENAAIPHHKPGMKKLKKGDAILIDFGVISHGYCSDMTRTFFFQEVSDEKRHAYNLVLNAQELGRSLLRSGAECKVAFNRVLDFFEKHQVSQYFTHSLGHGVGLDIHEAPTLKGRSEEILQDWDAVTCEPGLYFPGKFGIRIEDLGIVKHDTYEILTKTPKELTIIK